MARLEITVDGVQSEMNVVYIYRRVAWQCNARPPTHELPVHRTAYGDDREPVGIDHLCKGETRPIESVGPQPGKKKHDGRCPRLQAVRIGEGVASGADNRPVAHPLRKLRVAVGEEKDL